jgi:hypothetical protein
VTLLQGHLKGTRIVSAPFLSRQMASTSPLALVTVQSESGMQNRASLLQGHSKGTRVGSTLLLSHHMAARLPLALLTVQFESGMQTRANMFQGHSNCTWVGPTLSPSLMEWVLPPALMMQTRVHLLQGHLKGTCFQSTPLPLSHQRASTLPLAL